MTWSDLESRTGLRLVWLNVRHRPVEQFAMCYLVEHASTHSGNARSAHVAALCTNTCKCDTNPSQSYGASPTTRSVTCQPTQVNVARFNPSQAGQYLNCLPTEGWKAELTWMVGYIPRWFTCTQTVTHPGVMGEDAGDFVTVSTFSSK